MHQYLLKSFLLSGYIFRSINDGSYNNSVYLFFEGLQTIFQGATLFCITTSNARGFDFFPCPCQHLLFCGFTHVGTGVCVCFNESYSNRYEMVSHCVLDMHFSDDKGLNNFLYAS